MLWWTFKHWTCFLYANWSLVVTRTYWTHIRLHFLIFSWWKEITHHETAACKQFCDDILSISKTDWVANLSLACRWYFWCISCSSHWAVSTADEVDIEVPGMPSWHTWASCHCTDISHTDLLLASLLAPRKHFDHSNDSLMIERNRREAWVKWIDWKSLKGWNSFTEKPERRERIED